MRKFTPWILITFVAALVYLFAARQWLLEADNVYYDFLISKSLLSEESDVIIVGIDEASLLGLGAWPFKRSLHADLLGRLERADAVVFDIIFSESQSEVLENKALSADFLFASAIRSNERVFLPLHLSPNIGGFFPQEVLPIPLLADSAAGLGHIQLNFDQDGIARSIFLNQGVGDAYWPHIASATFKFLSGEESVPFVSWGSELPEEFAETSDVAPSDPAVIALEQQFNMRFKGPPGSYSYVSYIDVIQDRVPQQIWEDKLVFVGAIAEGLGDYVPTPVGFMAGVEFNANIYESINQNRGVRAASRLSVLLGNVVTFCITAILLMRLPPRWFLVATMVCIFVALVLTACALLLLNHWFPLGAYILGVVVFYPLWSWRRIEIALQFLLDELSELNAASKILPKHQGLESIERQLEGLKQIALIDSYRIDTAERKRGDNVDVPLWQAGSSQDFSTNFILDGVDYRLQVHSQLPKQEIIRSLYGVVVKDTARTDSDDASFELVERTIEQIQHARHQVDAVRTRMNRSMARLQDAVIITDASCRIVFLNIAAQKLFDHVEVDQSVVALDHAIGGHVWQSILVTLIRGAEPVYQELDVNNDSTVLCQASWLGREVLVNESSELGDHLLFVFTDVTSLRAAEQSKNEALAFLSHDMRAPIVSQLATIENIRQSGAASEYDLVLLTSLESFGRKSLKYAEDFLQLSRAENLDKRAFHLVDVHGVIDGAVSQQQGFALRQGVTLAVERINDDAWTNGDADLLERAISNLISNAIQHSVRGKTVTIKLDVDSQVMISVIDQGVGIAEDVMDQLFEPHFRSGGKQHENDDKRSRYGVKSYGLGLGFVRTVINRHGGQVDVQSVISQGSTFKILLPLVLPEIEAHGPLQ